MILRALLIPTVVLSTSSAAQQEFDGAAAMGYVQIQMAFGPRVPNTVGHRSTGDWIVEHLMERADTVLVDEWTHITQELDTLRLRNILGRFDPSNPSRVLFLAHWDTRPVRGCLFRSGRSNDTRARRQ